MLIDRKSTAEKLMRRASVEAVTVSIARAWVFMLLLDVSAAVRVEPRG